MAKSEKYGKLSHPEMNLLRLNTLPGKFNSIKGRSMNKKLSVLLLLTTLAAALFLTACPERTSIADIEANPSKYENKDIAIAGTVRDSYGVSIPGTNMRGGVYKIDDGTGSFWVITRESVPTKGARIGVKGRIGTGVNWNGRNYGLGMYEEDRRIAKK